MFIEYDITKDVRYQQGVEKGTEKVIIGIVNLTKKGFDPEFIFETLNEEKDFVLQIVEQVKLKDEYLNLVKKEKETPEALAQKLSIHPLLAKIWREGLDEK